METVYNKNDDDNDNNNNTCNAFHMKYKATVVLGYAINVMLATSPAGIAKVCESLWKVLLNKHDISYVQKKRKAKIIIRERYLLLLILFDVFHVSLSHKCM